MHCFLSKSMFIKKRWKLASGEKSFKVISLPKRKYKLIPEGLSNVYDTSCLQFREREIQFRERERERERERGGESGVWNNSSLTSK